MASKKEVKKKESSKKKKKQKKSSTNKKSNDKIADILVENFVSLQKVMVDLTERVDGLTNEVSGLVGLFEKTAKSIAEKEVKENRGPVNIDKSMKNLTDKLEVLLDQNKTIARGITLVHESISEEEETPQTKPTPQQPQSPQTPPQQGPQQFQQQRPPTQQQGPPQSQQQRPPQGQNVQRTGQGFQGYKKSLA
jgi:hypothetical protein